MLAPKLDERTLQQIIIECEGLAGVYTPDWQGFQDPADPGRGMIELFARLHELLLERLNKIPEKNFLSFLEMVGVEQFAGAPASAPLTFLLSKKATAGGLIPVGSQVATTQTQNSDARVFETRESFFATPARLQKMVNLVPGADSFSEIPLPALPPPAGAVLNDPALAITSLSTTTASLTEVDHTLFVGSEDLFGRKERIDLTLILTVSGGLTLFDAANLEWRRFDGESKSWIALSAQPTYTLIQPDHVEILFSSIEGTEKSSVAGVEDFWLACHLIASFGASLPLSVITSIVGVIAPPVGLTPTLQPDSVFFNNTQLDISKPFYPFGRRPSYADAFYFSSAVAFAPDIQSVDLNFTIRPYDDAFLQGIFANITVAATISTIIEWQFLDVNGVWKSLATFIYTVLASSVAPPVVTINRTSTPNGQIGADGTLYGESATWPQASVQISPFPALIGFHEVNGEQNYWLRALLKTENPYGGDGFLVVQAGIPVLVGPTFIPPIIEGFEIAYQPRPDQIAVTHIQTRNNFESRIHAPNSAGVVAPFQPFIPVSEHVVSGVDGVLAPEPALYFGFDKKFGPVFICMFFHLAEMAAAANFSVEGGDPQIAWEYLNSTFEWKLLDVNDDTADLKTSGVVSFLAPDDSASFTIFPSLFPIDETGVAPLLYWYRARLSAGTYDNPPRVLGLYLNTAMADNKTTHRQDPTSDVREFLIGSASGEQDQTIDLIPGPVLSGQLWVREPEIPTPLELQQLLDEFSESDDEVSPPAAVEDLYEIRTAVVTGAEPEVWVRWKRVPNFLSSEPRSRHFTLESVTATLTFGDSTNGLIPPAGKDNLVMREFQTGGGEKTNLVAVALAIKELKTSFPFVDKVFNVQQAEGGSDSWSLEQTLEFGPQIIKNRGQAVTTEDYEWMVRQQFSQVARVRCLATRQPAPGGGLAFKAGAVTLIVVPKSSDRLPVPSQGLLKNIREFLTENTLGNIVTDIYAIGPDFEEVRIEATVVPKKPQEASLVVRRVAVALENFLHPLSGGENDQGWPFGRPVFLSEIFAVIERTEGVDHVESALFPDAPLATSVAVAENSLAASGNHLIHIL